MAGRTTDGVSKGGHDNTPLWGFILHIRHVIIIIITYFIQRKIDITSSKTLIHAWMTRQDDKQNITLAMDKTLLLTR